MKKILVIRFSSIGDLVLISPVIRCVKEQTNADIHLLTKEKFAGIYSNSEHVTEIHTIDTSLSEVIDLLKKEKFDLIIDLHKNIRSLRVRAALKKRTVSFSKINFVLRAQGDLFQVQFHQVLKVKVQLAYWELC